MYTSPQGYICIYTSVYPDVSRESGYTSKGASHIHQSKNCLDVDGMSQFILYKDCGINNVHVMNTSLARRSTQIKLENVAEW